MKTLAARLSSALNWIVERVIALMMLLLVLDVWVGVVDRYLFHWQLPWPEVLARYLMIWMALLAISAGIARREHIGLTTVLDKLPARLRRPILLLMDLVCFVLFVGIAYYGIVFAEKGATRQAMIFGMTMFAPFLAVSVSMAIAAIQTLLVAARDQGNVTIHELVDYSE
jgi:TRAP-type C4-dicarboxylate transport system permease small subunit